MQTSEPKVPAQALVADEVAFLASLVALDGARVAELGCGAADFARKLVDSTAVADVRAYEVDEIQHGKNLRGAQSPRLAFVEGGAEDIDLPDASLDGVLMMKSLHHVPTELLDQALSEVARVLKPGGWLYVSEPVYDGSLNDVIKLFHDEGVVRAAAYRALGRAHDQGVLRQQSEIHFMAPVFFRDFADFEQRLIRTTHTHHDLAPDHLARVRAAFDQHMTPQGAKFTRPMRVNLMTKP